MWLILLNKSIIPYAVLFLGVFAFRFMTTFHRYLFFQLFFSMVFFTLSIQVILYALGLQQQPNNQWVFNISQPLETVLLIGGAYTYFNNKPSKRVTLIALGFFFIVFFAEILIKSYTAYCSYADSFRSLVLVVLYSGILYLEFNQEKTHWYHSPVIWICLGILFYFGATLPYISLFDFLQHKTNENDKSDNKQLFLLVNGIASALRHVFLAIGFWMIRRNALSSIPQSNV